jgi:hypothetical protein
MRRLLRHAPQGLRYRWHRIRQHAHIATRQGASYYVRWLRTQILLWRASRAGLRHVEVLDEATLRARRRSDRVFIFGSGYSLNDLTPEDWRHFEKHDVFGFSGFVHESWARVDFHLIRGWDEMPESLDRADRTIREYAELIVGNPHFSETVFVVQGELRASFGNRLLADRLLPGGARVFRYHTARRLDDRPSPRLSAGLSHGTGTLGDCVNLARLLGWKDIVLVGVDLYDSRYFWGPADATLRFDDTGREIVVDTNDQGLRWNEPHKTGEFGVVRVLGAWAREFARDGVRLAVFNRRSLLAEVLPVYARDEEAA